MGPIHIWKSTSLLNLNDDLAFQWNRILWSMRNGGFHRNEEGYKLIWNGIKGRSMVIVKEIYFQLDLVNFDFHNSIFPITFWKAVCSTKIILFTWLVFHNKNLTWDNLQKRNWSGSTICPLCKSNEESNFHIFLICPHSLWIWRSLAEHFGSNWITFSSIKDAFQWWSKIKADWRLVPLIAFWEIRKSQNRISSITAKIIISLFLSAFYPSIIAFSPPIFRVSKPQNKNMLIPQMFLVPILMGRLWMDIVVVGSILFQGRTSI